MAWVEQTGAQSWRVRYGDSNGRIVSVAGFGSDEQARSYAIELAARSRKVRWRIGPRAG